jgi:hypothetical protein
MFSPSFTAAALPGRPRRWPGFGRRRDPLFLSRGGDACHDDDASRHLVAREPAAGEPADRLLVERGSDRLHHGHDPLPEGLVRHTDDDAVGDGGVAGQHGLDLVGMDLLPTRVDHAVEPPVQQECAVGLEAGGVVEDRHPPPVDDGEAVVRPIVEVAERDQADPRQASQPAGFGRAEVVRDDHRSAGRDESWGEAARA